MPASENLLQQLLEKFQTNPDGSLKVGISADVHVDIDESSLATAVQLAATIAALAGIDAKLGVIDGHVDGLETTNASIDTKLTGVSTAANQTTGNASLTSLDGKVLAASSPSASQANANAGSVITFLKGWSGTNWEALRAGLTTVSNVFTGIKNTLPWAIYHLTPVIRTDGQGGPFETDAAGNLRVAEQNAPLYENNVDATASVHARPVASASYNAIPYAVVVKTNVGIIKAAPGNLYRVIFANETASPKVFYALFNKASTPVGGDVPVAIFAALPFTTLVIELTFGLRFTTGIAWAQVTTLATPTVLGALESTVTAEFA